MIFRVSNLEDFRKFEQDEDYPFPVFMRRLCGLEPPSTAMLAGTAFHKFLENAIVDSELEVAQIDDFTFIFDDNFELAVNPIKEIRLSKKYVLSGGGEIIVSGCVDSLNNLVIEDHKTTSSFDPDRYLEGYQWRFYLDIFQANEFVWNVFEMRPEGDEEDLVYNVKKLHRLKQYRYPNLHADCCSLVERFGKFLERQDVKDYLRSNKHEFR